MAIVSTLGSYSLAALRQVQSASPPPMNRQLMEKVSQKFGIDTSTLEDAFKQVRAERDRGSNFLSSLANKLNIAGNDLQEAFQQVRLESRQAPMPPPLNKHFLEKIAEKLSIDPFELQDAFKQAGSEENNGNSFLGSVANTLKIKPDDLLGALEEVRQESSQGLLSIINVTA